MCACACVDKGERSVYLAALSRGGCTYCVQGGDCRGSVVDCADRWIFVSLVLGEDHELDLLIRCRCREAVGLPAPEDESGGGAHQGQLFWAKTGVEVELQSFFLPVSSPTSELVSSNALPAVPAFSFSRLLSFARSVCLRVSFQSEYLWDPPRIFACPKSRKSQYLRTVL